ncbi:hypothetical protein A9Q93_05110 [Nonlabens dokdonensis]|uniref:Tyr recombinase domain-containing protein n=1 Tax=Nonlabens dokdonensis TaxID=328515 RepID=A0A1Z8B384_9FLAO|nr:tyrosine-type recombinase/integrase [Nonlabens dokdonensis]OUS17062.1 hypothetical protein A9Q93_05110 [Nonlabens dokdonensis]
MYLKNSISDTGLDTIKTFVPKFIKTRIVLRSYKNQDGKSMLYLHATSDGDRWRHPLDIYVYPKNWLKEKSRVSKNAKQYRDINLMLDNIDSQVTEIRTTFKLMSKPLTLEDFKNEMLYGVPRINFISYIEYRLKTMSLAPGTLRRYESIVTKLKTWNPNLIFHQIDHNFPDKYRKYCKKKGNKKSTIEGNCRFIKDMLIMADKDRIFYPLEIKDFKVQRYESSREYLLPEEMARLFKYYNNEFILSSHKLALGYFLISCVTGLRLSEVKLLKRNKLDETMVQLTAPKTGKKTTVYQTKEMKNLLSSCEDLCEIWLHENTINKYLKVIAKTCKIDKVVSMHVGRHTFSMAYLRAGGDLLRLKTILKHSKVDTTMIYVHQLEEEQAANTDTIGSLYH